MTGRDPFDEGREAAEDMRRALEALREDVREVVREEVAEAGLPPSELERLVREVVREELAGVADAPPRWRVPVLLAAGVVVGLLAGVGYRTVVGSGDGVDPPPPTATAESGGVEGRAGGESGTSPRAPAAGGDSSAGVPSGMEGSGDPGAGPRPGTTVVAAREMAARYDSLFASGSPDLEPLLADLEGAAAAPVLEALATWRGDPALDPGARRRLHDGLVQAAVNRLAGAGLVLDGLVTREPCRGASCGAVLGLWEERGAELGLPDYPSAPAAREAALPVVERVLVLRGVEAAGG